MAATFPTLRTHELVALLQDIGLEKVTSDDIDRPTPSKVVPIYVWFLESLSQLTLEDVMMTAQLKLDQIEIQDIFRETVHIGALHAVLNQIMTWACLDDFSFRDIRDPQPPRIRRVLSALVNFYLFEQDQIDHFNAIDDKAEEVSRLEHEAERRCVELEDAVFKKRQEVESKSRQNGELEEVNARTRQKLFDNKSKSKVLNDVIQSDSRVKDEMKDRIEELQMVLASIDADILKFRSRIISSPDRVKANLTEKSNQLNTMKSDIAEMERKTLDHKIRINTLKQYETEVSALIKSVDEWEVELNKVSNEQDRVRRLAEERDSTNGDVRELELRTQQMERRIASALEQRDRHIKQSETKREAMRQRMARTQETHESLMRERSEVAAESAQRFRVIAMKEKEISELSKMAEAERSRGEAAYSELRSEVLAYSAKLNKAIDGLNAYNALS